MARNFADSRSYICVGAPTDPAPPAIIDPPFTLAAIVRPGANAGYVNCSYHVESGNYVVDFALDFSNASGSLFLRQGTGGVKLWGGYSGFAVDGTHWYMMGVSAGSAANTSNLLHSFCYELGTRSYVF